MSLSEEEWNELKRLVGKIQIGVSNSPDQSETDSLNEKVRSLSLIEKAKLLKLSSFAFGAILYDAGELFNAKIRIDDYSSSAREKRPYAFVIHQNYTSPIKDLVETIDIFASIRKDATSVGHPVIVYAISRWQKIVLAANIIRQDNVYHRDETEREIDYLFNGSKVDNAERYLKEIGQTITIGLKSRSISTRSTLSYQIETLGLNEKNTYVFLVWQCLEKKWMLSHCGGDYDAETRIEAIRQHLERSLTEFGYDKIQANWIYDPEPTTHNTKGIFNDNIKLETVIDFLNEGGRKFVEAKETKNRFYDVSRPRFKVFSRAFCSWYLQKAPSTISNYLKDLKNQRTTVTENSNAFSYELSMEKDIFQILGEVLINPLIEAREPITISETETFNLEKTINQMGIK